MTIPNRSDLRDDVVDDLKLITWSGITPLADEAGGAEHVFGYLKKDPEGIAPFACVESGAIQYGLVSSDDLLTPTVLIIGFWARRGNADEHEVMLDNLAQQLAMMLRSKYMARFISRSVTDYEELDGVPYKFELHFVEFGL